MPAQPGDPFSSNDPTSTPPSNAFGNDAPLGTQTLAERANQQTKPGELGGPAREVKDHAKQSAAQVVEQAKEGAQQVKQGARELKNQVGQQAAEAARQLREKGQSLIGEQKTRAASTLEGLSRAIHDAGSRLDREEDRTIAGYVHGAADQVQVLAGYLKDKPVENLYQDACDLARRRPEVFVGGMFVAGLLLARFAKSSSSTGGNRSYSHNRERNQRLSAEDAARRSFKAGQSSTKTPVLEEVAGITNNFDAGVIAGPAPDVEPVTTTQQQPRGY